MSCFIKVKAQHCNNILVKYINQLSKYVPVKFLLSK